MDKPNYAQVNSEAVDGFVAEGWEWGIPISHEEYTRAAKGEWRVLLTPLISVPKQWFAPHIHDGRLNGAKLLGLASGGGQQMPVFAALGAECTVLDYSAKQLESERMVAQRDGYDINIVKADMTQKLPFADESFDIVFHPVANYFVQDALHVWRECYRVLKSGGILLAGMDNGIAFLFEEDDPLQVVNQLPYNPLKDEAAYERALQTDGCIQFSHSLEEQLGGQLQAGLALTDLYEDRSTGVLSSYAPLFIATRAVKK